MRGSTSGGGTWGGGVSSQLRTFSPQTLFASPRNVCTPIFHNILCPYTPPFCPRFVPMPTPRPVLLPLATTFVLDPVPALSATTSLQCASETIVRSVPAPAQLPTAPVLVSQPTSATSVRRHLAPVPTTSRTYLASPASLDYVSPVPVDRHYAPVSATAHNPAIVPGSSLRMTRSQHNFFYQCSIVPTYLDPVAHFSSVTRTTLAYFPDLNDFIRSCQSLIIPPPPPTSQHPATDLLSNFVFRGLRTSVGDPCSLDTIQVAILQVPHVSTCMPEATTFCREELVERVSRGFSLLLKADDALRVFDTRLCISILASVPQKNRRNRLICDSTALPPGGECLLPPHHRHKFPDFPPTPPSNAST